MRRIALTAILGLIATPALAHHPLGGAMPETILHGLMSGVGHPIIGPDHLAFIIAAGVLAALAGRTFLAPLGLVAGALGGAAIHLAALDLPAAEALIALSVVIAGCAVAFGARAGGALLIGGFAVAGLFHGYAYAEAVIGAESGVITAYLASFSAVQWGIAVLAGLGARLLIGTSAWARSRTILGSALALVGVVFLAQATVL